MTVVAMFTVMSLRYQFSWQACFILIPSLPWKES